MTAQEVSQHASDKIVETLFRRFDSIPGAWVYVVLDGNHPVPTQHALHPRILAERTPSVSLVPVRHPRRPSDATSWPQLLVLRSPDDHGWPDEQLLRLTFDTARSQCTSINGMYVSQWMVADSEPQTLAKRLGRSLLWRTPSGRPMSVSWFEPYLHTLLLRSHEFCAKLQYLLPHVHSWYWVDSRGELKTRHAMEAKGTDSIARNNVLNATDLATVRRSKQGRQALLALVKSGSQIPEDIENYIDDLLVRGKHMGLVQLEDLLCFVVQSIELGSGWYGTTTGEQCMELAIRKTQSLAGALDALSPAACRDLIVTSK